MGNFNAFMKANKKEKSNAKYAPTTSMVDEKGNPLEWEFRHLPSKENEELRDECMIDIPVTGKPNLYRQKFMTKDYLVGLIVRCTVVPNLQDEELQDSYGVIKPEDLVYAMIDDPGEYSDLCAWLQKFNGFTETLDEKVEEAKN